MKWVITVLTGVSIVCSGCGGGGSSDQIGTAQATDGNAIQMDYCYWAGTQYISLVDGATCTPDTLPSASGYPHSTYAFPACAQQSASTGTPYIPIKTNGTSYCVELSIIEPYALGTDYETYGYNYFHAYPIYEGCSTPVDFGYGSINLCF